MNILLAFVAFYLIGVVGRFLWLYVTYPWNSKLDTRIFLCGAFAVAWPLEVYDCWRKRNRNG